jgi:hypothetical protein
MNKRNNMLAIIVLAMLVVLLVVGKGCVRVCRTTFDNARNTPRVDCLLDLNLASDFDSATMKACNMPIVVHFPKPTNVNGSKTQMHILSLNPEALETLVSGKEGLATDSTQSIHIYTKFLRSKTSSLNLFFYNKLYMKEVVSYVVTYPVRDSSGLHVVVDSGMISNEHTWKGYGKINEGKNKQESEREMTKELEKNLIQDVAKKMNAQ